MCACQIWTLWTFNHMLISKSRFNFSTFFLCLHNKVLLLHICHTHLIHNSSEYFLCCVLAYMTVETRLIYFAQYHSLLLYCNVLLFNPFTSKYVGDGKFIFTFASKSNWGKYISAFQPLFMLRNNEFLKGEKQCNNRIFTNAPNLTCFTFTLQSEESPNRKRRKLTPGVIDLTGVPTPSPPALAPHIAAAQAAAAQQAASRNSPPGENTRSRRRNAALLQQNIQPSSSSGHIDRPSTRSHKQ